MTQRKPPGMSFESWIEDQIRKAREEGEFDDLSNKGKPISGLGKGYDPLWWVKSLVRREQVSVLPAALEIKVKVEKELEQIWKSTSEEDVRARVKALNVEIVKVNRSTTSGPPTSVGVLDVESIVEEWAERRR